jgi:cell division septal protein FtsQ
MIKATLALIACGLGVALYFSPGALGVKVARVVVEGARLVDANEADSAAAEFVGQPMSKGTCRDLRARLCNHWAVERAEVTMAWPRTIEARIIERSVVGRVDEPRPAAIDLAGNLIEAAEIPAALPLLVGWRRHPAWDPVLASVHSLSSIPELWAGSVVSALPRDGYVEVECPGARVRVFLPCPPDAYLDQRASYALTVLADMRTRGEVARVLDLRWGNQIVVAEGEA